MTSEAEKATEAARRGDAAAESAEGRPENRAVSSLGSLAMDEFRRNMEHRHASGVEKMLEDAGMAANLKYTARQKAILAGYNIDERNYRPLTAMFMRAAKAALTKVLKSSGDKPYTLSPTPMPTIPKRARREIVSQMAREIADFYRSNGGQVPTNADAFYMAILQRVAGMYDEVRRRESEWAKIRCERMDAKIHDLLIEGHFIDEALKMLDWICTYGTAVMIGPVPRVVPKPRCRESRTLDGAVSYDIEYDVGLVYEAVSPWDCYPAPNAKSIEDGTFCRKVRYTPNVLRQFAEAKAKDRPEGWRASSVKVLLSKHPKGGVRLDLDNIDMVRREIERNAVSTEEDCTLEGVQCFGSFRGSELIDCGMTKAPAGEEIVYDRYYKTEVIVIDNLVVYCRVIDDRMRIPIAKVCLYETADSWWGVSIAEFLASAQTMQNNAMKNLTLNGGLSSNGIFYCTDVDRAVSLDGAPALALRAGRMLGFRGGVMGGQGAPIGSIEVKDTTQSQIMVMEKAKEMANDDCGISLHMIGSTANLGSGAARTASGLAMIMESGSSVIDMVICGIGRNLIVPVVKNTHVYVLCNDPDVSIKGDVEVNPSGLVGAKLREAESQRRQQVTAMLGSHPVLSKALTVEAFFELVRPELDGLGVNPDKIIPSKERMEFYQQLMDLANASAAATGAEPQPNEAAQPTPEQSNVARVEGRPEEVAATQGSVPAAFTVEERRGAA